MIGAVGREADSGDVRANSSTGIQPEISKRAVVAPHRRGLGRPFLRAKRADDRFKNVGGGHHTLEVSVLVVHETDVDGRCLEDRHDVAGIDRIRDHRRVADEGPDVELLARHAGVEQLLGLHDAEHLVGIAVVNRQARMRALRDRRADLLRRAREIDHVDVPARRHHGAHRPIAEPHHAGDHLLLAGLEHAGAFRFRDQGLDFLLGDPFLGRAVMPEQPQRGLAGDVEHPYQRRGDLREHGHRRARPGPRPPPDCAARSAWAPTRR